MLSRFSRVQLCATPRTAAHQAPLSTGFSRQEHWSGLPFPSPYIYVYILHSSGFPSSSVGKESAYNSGDPDLIPGLGRSPGEGNGYPLQYSGLEKSTDCTESRLQRIGQDWATFTFTFKSIKSQYLWEYKHSILSTQCPSFFFILIKRNIQIVNSYYKNTHFR